MEAHNAINIFNDFYEIITKLLKNQFIPLGAAELLLTSASTSCK